MESEIIENVEEQAKTLGWRPKEEWKGDPDKWRPAEEFVKRGQEMIPILKENNKRLIDEVSTLKTDIQKIIEYTERQQEEAKKAGYEQAMKELNAKKKEAFEAGDWEATQKIDQEAERLRNEASKRQPESNVPKEFTEFVRDNEWYTRDPEMRHYAETAGAAIAKDAISRGMSLTEAYKLVTAEVKRRFPENFQEKKKESPVDGGGHSVKSGGKTFSDLPKSAQAQYHRLEKQFSLKGKEFKKEDYLKHYKWE